MSTLLLDSTGDLSVVNNSLVVETDLVAETAQRLRTKFRFFLGEWHLDSRVGFPLFEKVFVKAPNINDVTAAFRETLTDDPTVSQINFLTVDIVRATRKMSVSFEVTLNDGSSLVFENFILEENR